MINLRRPRYGFHPARLFSWPPSDLFVCVLSANAMMRCLSRETISPTYHFTPLFSCAVTMRRDAPLGLTMIPIGALGLPTHKLCDVAGVFACFRGWTRRSEVRRDNTRRQETTEWQSVTPQLHGIKYNNIMRARDFPRAHSNAALLET